MGWWVLGSHLGIRSNHKYVFKVHVLPQSYISLPPIINRCYYLILKCYASLHLSQSFLLECIELFLIKLIYISSEIPLNKTPMGTDKKSCFEGYTVYLGLY